MSSVRSILLCAGRGERLRPLTDLVPKPALPVLDIPLAAWGLKALAALGPTVVNIGHAGDEVVSALEPFGSFEVLAEHPEPFGTAGTVAALAERVRGRVVTYNGDQLADVDVAGVLATHERGGRLGTVVVQQVASGADLVVDDARVSRFIDRRVTDSPGARFIGIGVWEEAALDRLPTHHPAGLGETLFTALVESGELGVHVHDGYALDVGTPERYLRANLDVLARIAPPPPVSPPGRIDRDSYLGLGATATDARGSVLLAGARARQVERSLVWRDEVVEEPLVDALWAHGRRLC